MSAISLKPSIERAQTFSEIQGKNPGVDANAGREVIKAATAGNHQRIQDLLTHNEQIPQILLDVAATKAVVNQDPKGLRLLLNDRSEKAGLLDLAAKHVSVACMRVILGIEPKEPA